MQIRSILIDDEKNNIGNLRNLLLTYCPEILIAGEALSADEAASLINRIHPDLIFLDIRMPHKSGFDLLRSLPDIYFEIIFVTAYDQYGIQAIRFSALDYLLKPVNISELQVAVSKAKQRIISKQTNRNLQNLLGYLKKAPSESPRIALPTQQETHYIKVNEIVRCEASDNYTLFRLDDGRKIIVSRTLKEFAELLKPHGFERTHQSHLVNIHAVKSLLKEDGGVLLLADGSRVPVSRQNLETVKQTLNNLLKL